MRRLTRTSENTSFEAGDGVEVLDVNGLDERLTGVQGTLRGFTTTHGYAVVDVSYWANVISVSRQPLLVHPENLGPLARN